MPHYACRKLVLVIKFHAGGFDVRQNAKHILAFLRWGISIY